MTRRPRLLTVIATLSTGALGVISSTQTWFALGLLGGEAPMHEGDLLVTGAEAVPVLAPLSLALLALGLALSIVGRVLRYVFGVLALSISIVLGVLTWRAAAEHPTSAFARTVTDATGITGTEAVSQLVIRITSTTWPWVTLVGWVVLFAASGLVLTTAHTWSRAGRRYEAPSTSAIGAPGPQPAASRPADQADSRRVDDWDDLSRGEDPTA